MSLEIQVLVREKLGLRLIWARLLKLWAQPQVGLNKWARSTSSAAIKKTLKLSLFVVGSSFSRTTHGSIFGLMVIAAKLQLTLSSKLKVFKALKKIPVLKSYDGGKVGGESDGENEFRA